jgi:hypothetical protein
MDTNLGQQRTGEGDGYNKHPPWALLGLSESDPPISGTSRAGTCTATIVVHQQGCLKVVKVPTVQYICRLAVLYCNLGKRSVV